MTLLNFNFKENNKHRKTEMRVNICIINLSVQIFEVLSYSKGVFKFTFFAQIYFDQPMEVLGLFSCELIEIA